LFRIEDARKCPHLFKAKYKVKESKKNLWKRSEKRVTGFFPQTGKKRSKSNMYIKSTVHLQ
jgi:hypothetical protein